MEGLFVIVIIIITDRACDGSELRFPSADCETARRIKARVEFLRIDGNSLGF